MMTRSFPESVRGTDATQETTQATTTSDVHTAKDNKTKSLQVLNIDHPGRTRQNAHSVAPRVGSSLVKR